MAKASYLIARITPDAYKSVAKFMDEEIRKLNKFSDALSKELAERAWDVADDEFANAKYDGVNDVIVTIDHSKEHGYSVVAKGEAVAYIEYGTGVTYAGQYEGDPKSIPSWVDPVGNHGKHILKNKGHDDAWRFAPRPGTTLTGGGATQYQGNRLAPKVRKRSEGATGRDSTLWARPEVKDKWGQTIYVDTEEDVKKYHVRKRDIGMPLYKRVPSGKEWVYTFGNPANSCMFHAYSYAVEDFDWIVDEVSNAKL